MMDHIRWIAAALQHTTFNADAIAGNMLDALAGVPMKRRDREEPLTDEEARESIIALLQDSVEELKQKLREVE